jgi:hypothetical protein
VPRPGDFIGAMWMHADFWRGFLNSLFDILSGAGLRYRPFQVIAVGPSARTVRTTAIR